MIRDEQAKWATKLQNALGSDYYIHFDASESGMTVCAYKNIVYKTVPNDDMCGNINVLDFKAPFDLLISNM